MNDKVMLSVVGELLDNPDYTVKPEPPAKGRYRGHLAARPEDRDANVVIFNILR
jgi:hypothetical protein